MKGPFSSPWLHIALLLQKNCFSLVQCYSSHIFLHFVKISWLVWIILLVTTTVAACCLHEILFHFCHNYLSMKLHKDVKRFKCWMVHFCKCKVKGRRSNSKKTSQSFFIADLIWRCTCANLPNCQNKMQWLEYFIAMRESCVNFYLQSDI